MTASLHGYEAADRYELITCVHGLHYIGAKLGLLARACGWLTEDGVLVRANGHVRARRLRHPRSHGRAPRPRALRGEVLDERMIVEALRRTASGSSGYGSITPASDRARLDVPADRPSQRLPELIDGYQLHRAFL